MLNTFSTLFEFLPIGAYRSLPDGKLLRANAALVRLTDYSSEAELMNAVRDIAGELYVLPGRRAEFARLIEAEGRVLGFESEVYRHKTRERIWVSENAHAVRDAQGELLFYEGTLEDITERVAARDALRLSQERLRQIIELVPGMVFRVVVLPDGQRRATFSSHGARALLGLTPEEVLADGHAVRRLCHPEDVLRIDAAMARAAIAQTPLQIEFRLVLDSGQVKWVQLTSAAAPPEDGLPVRVGLIFDITAARQAEVLRYERDRAAAADQAKSQFLSRVSHELRTPLNAVLGFSQLLALETGLNPRQQRWLDQVLTSSQHLLALMDDVLDISSADTGQLRVHAQPQALALAVGEALDMLVSAAQAAGITLHDDCATGAPLRVHADRRRLKQIITNLVGNAIKYNRPGGWVRLSAVALQDAGAEMVAFCVADSGPGLDAAQCARLFEPFERLGAQQGPVPGTGLGLALSQQLARAMGGRIDVASQPGQGASFTLLLPAA